jgi:uncharacterized phiE125 gp8 family phage protein
MSSILLTPPAVEPVTLADIKAFLRVEHNDDDAVISGLIAAARTHVEVQTRRALITQTWRLIRDAWPRDGRIAVLPVPLVDIVAVRVFDEHGTAQSIDLDGFVTDAAAAPAIIAFASWSVAAPGRMAGGVEIDIEAGYGDAPDDVPAPLRQAMRVLVAHWFESRGLAALGRSVAELPAGFAGLIAPYRVLPL